MSRDYDLIGMYAGPPLRIHPQAWCEGEHCCIHNPSQHPLNTRPLNWRGHVMERVCQHGVGHPDPDDSAWRRRQGKPVRGVHGCDGCCTGAYLVDYRPVEPDERVPAPWEDDQVASLNTFQAAGMATPYLCPDRFDGQHPELGAHHVGTLLASRDGLTCAACGHVQAWAHCFTVNWSWRLDGGV